MHSPVTVRDIDYYNTTNAYVKKKEKDDNESLEDVNIFMKVSILVVVFSLERLTHINVVKI